MAKKENTVVATGISIQEYTKFFKEDLKDIYWVEKTLTKKLPKIAKNATSTTLKEAIEGHLKETERHVKNVEKAFGYLDIKPTAKKCEAMDGILTEGEELMDEYSDNEFLRDVAIIVASQKVEHYEITAYGNLITVAKKLGYPKIADVLIDCLKDEKAADSKLSEVFEEIHNNATFEEK